VTGLRRQLAFGIRSRQPRELRTRLRDDLLPFAAEGAVEEPQQADGVAGLAAGEVGLGEVEADQARHGDRTGMGWSEVSLAVTGTLGL